VLVLQATAEPAELPAPHVLWVAPEIVLAAPQRTTLPPLSVNGPQAAAMAARDPGAPATADEPRPLISILTPVHDPDPRMLGELLRAVRRQPFTDWELCLVDDGGADLRVRELLEQAAASDARIHLRRRPQNGGISVATNDALGMARGRYVAFLDHDDVLAEDALGAVAEAIAADPSLDALYTDEDHITHADQRFAPLRKPDWSPDSLRSQMYTGHLGVLRRELVDDVGGLRPEFEGSQDYDLMLRISERTARIDHVDQLLYHWRVVPSSASFGDRAKPYAYEAGKRALQEHADRLRLRASVVHGETRGTYRMVYETDPRMAVDIVLDVRAEPPRGLPAVLEAAGHERWRLVLLGCQEGALRWEAALAAGGIERDRIMRLPDLAALGNDATAPGELLLFVSEAPSRATDGWLRTMMGFAGLEGVAAVGAKVLAADGRLERGGVVIGHGLPLPVCHAARGDEAGHLSNLVTTVNRSAVDGVVMARRDVLDRVGWIGPSLSDTALADYCLRAREKDLRVIWTPDARLQLGGPASAGDVAALDAFRTRWAARMGADPFYSRAFSQQRADYTPV
jgi:glycosyltransferase involved in cell wall biosynthesis